tara:strand:+ start:7024 stop:8721 length:1698 start_codon:yes stop_codon:yes gene_type:complete
MNFTQEQLNIFEYVKNGTGHGIINAVAGAGKTTTIMEAAQYTSNPSDLLFCAFNRSIAQEIHQRFQKKQLTQVTTKTIHSLGLQILQSNNSTGNRIVVKENKYKDLIKNEEISNQLLPSVKGILKLHGLAFDEYVEKQDYNVTNLIRKITTRLLEINQKYRLTLCKETFSDLKNMVHHYGIFNEVEFEKRYFDRELEYYFEAHKILLENANSFSQKHMIIDYSDMLYLPYIWKLTTFKKYNYLFIDECQDLSRSQLAVALKYANKGGRILSVGDPSQSIYGFTGADIDSFSNIEKITNAVKLPLTLCFRCPRKVLELAKEFRTDILGSKHYDGLLEEIHLNEVVQSAKSNDLIISRIKEPILLLTFGFIESEKKIQIHPDIANDLIYMLRGLFKIDQITRNIELGFGGFENLKSDALQRKEWIINKEAERIIDAQQREFYVKDELRMLNSKLEFLHKRYEIWKSSCKSLEAIFKRIKEYISEKDNPITISTIHTAKGLEANRVFILDFKKLPLKRPEQKEWEKVQELNLKYVAVTRAKEELYLVNSENQEEVKDDGSLFDDLFEI